MPPRHVDLQPTHYARGWRALKRRHRWRVARDLATIAFGIAVLVLAAVIADRILKGR